MNVGDRLIVHFTNKLPQASTVHWHGIRVPIEMDGVPGISQPEVPPADHSHTISSYRRRACSGITRTSCQPNKLALDSMAQCLSKILLKTFECPMNSFWF